MWTFHNKKPAKTACWKTSTGVKADHLNSGHSESEEVLRSVVDIYIYKLENQLRDTFTGGLVITIYINSSLSMHEMMMTQIYKKK